MHTTENFETMKQEVLAICEELCPNLNSPCAIGLNWNIQKVIADEEEYFEMAYSDPSTFVYINIYGENHTFKTREIHINLAWTLLTAFKRKVAQEARKQKAIDDYKILGPFADWLYEQRIDAIPITSDEGTYLRLDEGEIHINNQGEILFKVWNNKFFQIGRLLYQLYMESISHKSLPEE